MDVSLVEVDTNGERNLFLATDEMVEDDVVEDAFSVLSVAVSSEVAPMLSRDCFHRI